MCYIIKGIVFCHPLKIHGWSVWFFVNVANIISTWINGYWWMKSFNILWWKLGIHIFSQLLFLILHAQVLLIFGCHALVTTHLFWLLVLSIVFESWAIWLLGFLRCKILLVQPWKTRWKFYLIHLVCLTKSLLMLKTKAQI
jgi:hypothetical protein